MVDMKLLTALNDIRSIHAEVYSSLRLNIETVYKKVALGLAEQAFLTQDSEEHHIFRVNDEIREQFAEFLGLSTQNNLQFYFIAAKSLKYGVAYVQNTRGYIVSRIPIFNKPQISSILLLLGGDIVLEGSDRLE